MTNASRKHIDQDEIERLALRSEVLGAFPRNRIGQALAAQALALFDAAADAEARHAASMTARYAASYADSLFRANAYRRDGDLSEWFGLPETGVAALARRQEELIRAWQAAASDEDDEEDEERFWSEDEEEAAYGRTLPFDPESADWIWVRFGRMPKDGRSRFGLAGEDNEDGPDPWRQELGNMTHEAGVCVFRCHMHPDVPGAYVLMSPDFSKARYQVPSQEGHLLAVIPDEEGEDPEAWLLRGTPVTVKARDGSLRCDLGSDGEYLLRPGAAAEPMPLDRIYVHREQSVEDFLKERRGYLAAPPL